MRRTFLTILLLVAISLPIWLISSCGDTSPTGEVTNTHVIKFVHALLAEDNQVHSYLTITRNDEPFNLAAIGLYNDTDTLAIAVLSRISDLGTYSASFNDFELDTTLLLRTELNSAIDQFSFAAPGLPGNIVRSTDGAVQLDWTGSRKAHGYFVVIEPAEAGNEAVGYNALVSSQTTSVSVPVSAFHDNLGFREGNYNVWVVAYHDNPVDSPDLPFTLPDGFTANIERVGISGQAGAIYVPEKLVLTAETVQ